MTNSLQFQDLKTQQEELLKILLQSEDIKLVLDNAEKLNLPNWYLAAGAISQTVWNHLTGADNPIADYDIVYYDESDLSKESENKMELEMQRLLGDKPFKVDLKNQASIHLQYEQIVLKHYGIPGFKIDPYKCTEDAISSWITTITCVGVTKRNGEYRVFAAYGLSELFGMIVRANKKQITKEIYDTKCEKWKKKWPQLTIIDWDK